MLIVQGNEENPFFITDKYINKRHKGSLLSVMESGLVLGIACDDLLLDSLCELVERSDGVVCGSLDMDMILLVHGLTSFS